MAWRLPSNGRYVRVFQMNWIVVVIAAQITGCLLFWHLCRTAPVVTEDHSEDDVSALQPSDERQQGPDQNTDPAHNHDQHPT